MLEKLKSIEENYLQLRDQLYDPIISADPKKSMQISKQMAEIEEMFNLAVEYRSAVDQQKEAKDLMANETDDEMISLAKQQLQESENKIYELEEAIKIALLPRDPNDDKNIFLEIRPAAWWDEAGLFAAELFRAYLRYAELKWWKTEIVDNDMSDIGWLKSATVKISWDKVYSKLKYESGVHRVQRIPETESKWRVHTSTITVAVLPEIEDVEVELRAEDIIMDTYAASSAWWQNANKNQTWVRLHHKPTWIIVNIWDSKSQLQNKERAYTILKAKLYQIEVDKQQSDLKTARLDQIWTWDRSEKIKTYNFPQDRLTDHRIKKSWSNLPAIMNWEIDDMINDMVLENQSRLLSSQTWE